MKVFAFIIWSISILLLGAIGHERDIYRTCIEKGHSSMAMWTKKIECKDYNVN